LRCQLVWFKFAFRILTLSIAIQWVNLFSLVISII